MLIGINGMGRIGRLALRALEERYPDVGIFCSDRNWPEIVLPLIERDSIYGKRPSAQPVAFLRADADWPDVDVVLECAGGGPDGNKARKHLERGAKHVIISAAAENVDATLTMGVNEEIFDAHRHKIISMSSCTTNCVTVVLKILERFFTLGDVWMDSVNAYTNSQRIVDAPHNDPRRARAAALNIIPSESSTGKSVGIVLPFLRGRYSGRAFRVPVACGSLCSISAQIYRQKVAASDINNVLKEAAGDYLKGILEYSEEPLVSSDIVGNPHSAIVDGLLTEVHSQMVHLVAWYDNEWAYACRLADLAMYLGNGRTDMKKEKKERLLRDIEAKMRQLDQKVAAAKEQFGPKK